MPRRDSNEPCLEALFRYRLVCEVASRVLRGELRGAAVHGIAARDHYDLSGNPRHVSERTLNRWHGKYKQHGFDGLRPAERTRVERSLVLGGRFLDFLSEEKPKDPQASVPELIRRAREQGIVRLDEGIDRSSVYRALKRMGVYVGRRKRSPKDRDSRRFAYPHRMQMLLCDGKHFRAGVLRARRVALFFLDDASRAGLWAIVGTSESAALFLHGLYQTTRRHGIAEIYYLDKGCGFTALDTIEVVRKLGALLIHGETAYPEGHGKIEKFNQTALHDVLRGYDGRPDIDPDPQALSLRLQHYLREVYNHRPHEGIGNQTPWERYSSDERPLRMPQSDEELRGHFVLYLRRRVTPDHTVPVGSVDYEVPRGHAGERILVHRRLLDGTLAVVHEGRLVEIHPVDLHANARASRGRRRDPREDPQHPLPKSAADMAFERDFLPVVDADGGFSEE